MSAATKLIAIILLWGVMGLVWASFNDVITTTLPASFPTPTTTDADTWNTLLFIWTWGAVILAASSGMAIMGGSRIGGIIRANVLIFSVWITILFLWPMFWSMLNFDLQTATNQATNTTTAQYDAVMEFLMIGLALIAIVATGGVSFSMGEKRNIRAIQPKYIKKKYIYK